MSRENTAGDALAEQLRLAISRESGAYNPHSRAAALVADLQGCLAEYDEAARDVTMSHENTAGPSAEMVERAAREIHANSFGSKAPWEHLTPAIRESFCIQARAALTAALSGTTTEWGVRRRGDGVPYPAVDRKTAQTLVERYPDVYAAVVSREVAEWREVEA